MRDRVYVLLSVCLIVGAFIGGAFALSAVPAAPAPVSNLTPAQIAAQRDAEACDRAIRAGASACPVQPPTLTLDQAKGAMPACPSERLCYSIDEHRSK